MQVYRSILIFLTASIGLPTDCSNLFFVTASITDQTANSAVDMKHQYQYLRSLTNAAHPSVSTSTSDIDKLMQKDRTSRRNDVTYSIDKDGNIYSEYNDDFYQTYVESCDGFRYELDDNGVCKISTGFAVLIVFVHIAIVVGIIIASCSCCKCCMWYPYLCCASKADRLSGSNPRGNGAVAQQNKIAVGTATTNNSEAQGAGTETSISASKKSNVEPEIEC